MKSTVQRSQINLDFEQGDANTSTNQRMSIIGSNHSQGGMSGMGMMYQAMKGGFGSMILVQNTFK